jgi:hypothetical protein
MRRPEGIFKREKSREVISNGICVLSRDPDSRIFQNLFEQSVDSIHLCSIGPYGQIDCQPLAVFCQMMSVVSPRAFALTNTSRGVTASASAISALPMETRTMGVGLSMINDCPTSQLGFDLRIQEFLGGAWMAIVLRRRLQSGNDL